MGDIGPYNWVILLLSFGFFWDMRRKQENTRLTLETEAQSTVYITQTLYSSLLPYHCTLSFSIFSPLLWYTWIVLGLSLTCHIWLSIIPAPWWDENKKKCMQRICITSETDDLEICAHTQLRGRICHLHRFQNDFVTYLTTRNSTTECHLHLSLVVPTLSEGDMSNMAPGAPLLVFATGRQAPQGKIYSFTLQVWS